jgi:hypothetical protein
MERAQRQEKTGFQDRGISPSPVLQVTNLATKESPLLAESLIQGRSVTIRRQGHFPERGMTIKINLPVTAGFQNEIVENSPLRGLIGLIRGGEEINFQNHSRKKKMVMIVSPNSERKTKNPSVQKSTNMLKLRNRPMGLTSQEKKENLRNHFHQGKKDLLHLHLIESKK